MRRIPSRLLLGASVVAYCLFALASGEMGVIVGRPMAMLALATVPLVVFGVVPRRRPALALYGMVAGGAILRVAIAYSQPMTDQIETTQAAWSGVLAGVSPYGAPIAGTSTNAPFPYGPLAMPAYIPGVWTEVAAAILVMAILAHYRSWLTLAGYAACPIFVRATVMGLNDTLPGLLILLGLLEARRSPRLAAAILAIAVAVKPYAAAWIPGLLGLGGLSVAVVAAGVSLALWAPVLFGWGVPAFLHSLELADAQHTETFAALNIPAARILALPLSLVALLARSWHAMCWIGLAIYLVVLFFAHWASLGYLLAVVPIVGLLLEGELAERRPGRERVVAGIPVGGYM